MPRKGSYLFKRKGSQNWWVRFQYRWAGRTIKKERSLGTPDRAEAEILAADDIKSHKLKLLTDKRSRDGTLKSTRRLRYEPNREHNLADGTRVIATETQLMY